MLAFHSQRELIYSNHNIVEEMVRIVLYKICVLLSGYGLWASITGNIPGNLKRIVSLIYCFTNKLSEPQKFWK